MPTFFRDPGHAPEWRAGGENPRVEALGRESIRVRAIASRGPQAGARPRGVHLPAGASRTGAWAGWAYGGGGSVTVDAPLHRMPLFPRSGASLPATGVSS
ncbi:hypothetical protein [Streptomyces sp. NPDC049040]|uniref:hypothetical protein n=1 Tax=Streptomyces sp. NPDC049040 TaxID=3365593 RepID=UPI0037152FEE